MNNVIIKVNNSEEYKKTLNILGGLGVIWESGETIDVKDGELDSNDLTYRIYEMSSIYGGKEYKENEPLICLIIEQNKLFWEWLDNMIKLDNMTENKFSFKDYEVYAFRDFEKMYSL